MSEKHWMKITRWMIKPRLNTLWILLDDGEYPYIYRLYVKYMCSVTRTVSNKVYLASSERFNRTWNRKCKDINSLNTVCLKIRRTVDNVFNYLADEYNKYCLQWFLGIKKLQCNPLVHSLYILCCMYLANIQM